MRKFSADILGLAHSDRAIEGLAKALYDPAENVGVAAAEALGKIQSPKALPHLIAGFKNRDYLKRECAEALGMLNVPDGAHFLMEQFFATDDLLVQYAMVDGMGNAGDLKVLEFLGKNITKITGPLNGPTALALLKIARREHINLLGRDDVPLENIIQSLSEGGEEYQQLLIDQLDESLDPAILLTLSRAKDSLSSNGLVALIKVAAPHSQLSKFILEMVDHADDWVAYTAIEHLTRMDEAVAAETIKRVLAGSRNLPQLAAIKVVQHLDVPEAREWIRPFLDSEDDDLRAMAEQVLGGLMGSAQV